MKLVASQLLVAGAIFVIAASSLRAQTPEQLPEPPAAANRGMQEGSVMRQQPGAAPDNAPPEMYQNDQNVDQNAEYDAQQCDDGPAYPYTSGQWWRDGCWYGEFDFLVWHRTRAHDGILGIDASGFRPGDVQNLNRHGTALGLEPGGEGTLGYILDRDIDNRDHSIELNYLGFNNWESHDGLVAETPGSLRTPLAPDYGGFNFADTYSTFYRSSLQEMDLDYRVRNRPGRDRMIMGSDGFWSRQITPGMTQSVMVGISGLQENEDFRWLSLQNNVSPSVFSGDFHTHTDNTLLGIHVGGDCYDLHEGWYWGVRGNVGAYANFSHGSADIVVEDPNAPENPIHSRTTAQVPACFGRLSVVTGLNVNSNMMVYCSYDMAVVAGISVASDQVSFYNLLANTPPTMNTGGNIFYNGFSVGLEAYW